MMKIILSGRLEATTYEIMHQPTVDSEVFSTRPHPDKTNPGTTHASPRAQQFTGESLCRWCLWGGLPVDWTGEARP